MSRAPMDRAPMGREPMAPPPPVARRSPSHGRWLPTVRSASHPQWRRSSRPSRSSRPPRLRRPRADVARTEPRRSPPGGAGRYPRRSASDAIEPPASCGYACVQDPLLASACTRRNAGSGPEHPADREGDPTVNKVFLTGRLTRDPEMRSLASGKNVTTFTVASNEYLSGGREKAEYSNVVTWDRLAEIAGTYLGKGQQVAVEGRLQTRSWDDERGTRHWKTEVVASHVEMLSGRRKKDYAAESAANGLAAQAAAYGEAAEDDEDAAIAAAAEPLVDEEVVA